MPWDRAPDEGLGETLTADDSRFTYPGVVQKTTQKIQFNSLVFWNAGRRHQNQGRLSGWGQRSPCPRAGRHLKCGLLSTQTGPSNGWARESNRRQSSIILKTRPVALTSPGFFFLFNPRSWFYFRFRTK